MGREKVLRWSGGEDLPAGVPAMQSAAAPRSSPVQVAALLDSRSFVQSTASPGHLAPGLPLWSAVTIPGAATLGAEEHPDFGQVRK